MAVKELTFDIEARQALLAGVEKLARAVKSTLGPRGRNAILDKSWGGPSITKDGVSVAEEIELRNKAQNMGARLVKEAASKTSDEAGDGTTTATVLAEALFREGLRHIAAGVDANALIRGMKKGVEATVGEIKKLSKPVDRSPKSGDIQNIATISANNDPTVGKIIADAFTKVGADGVITIEEGKTQETTVDVVEGMQFDRGYISPNFVTNSEEMTVEFEKALVLIHEDKIESVSKLVPLLEKVMQAKKPLLIIAEDVSGEALSTLVINKLRGTLQVCAVKAPGYGDRRKAMLEDIAVLTGGKAIMEELGIELDKVTLADLGRAKKVTIDKDNTTIVEGAGSPGDIKARIEQIRHQVEATTSDYDREKLEERLAKLAGGVAQINVGAATEVEMKEKKARVEDALHACRAAVEEGILPGGGVAILRARRALEKARKKATGDEKIGIDIIDRAVSYPIKQIAANTGLDGSIIAMKVEESKDNNFGFNAMTHEYGDLMQMGVIVPTKVERVALQNAASIAGLLLTTDAAIVELKDKKKGAAVPAGGGMDDMDY